MTEKKQKSHNGEFPGEESAQSRISIERCQQERDEYLNNWKKERADFLNYKKDEARRIEEFVRFANEDLIGEVIEVLDDLERAGKEIKNEGLNNVIKKSEDLLKKYKVEKISVEGRFDPLLHEAVIADAQNNPAESQNNADNTEEKLEEVRPGYTMHGRVIRPARVKIVK